MDLDAAFSGCLQARSKPISSPRRNFRVPFLTGVTVRLVPPLLVPSRFRETCLTTVEAIVEGVAKLSGSIQLVARSNEVLVSCRIEGGGIAAWSMQCWIDDTSRSH